MLYQIPRKLPAFGLIYTDLGRPHPSNIAAALGVDESTVRRWIKAGDAPRPALLALFWVTQWGASQLDAELFNRWRLSDALCVALRAEMGRIVDRPAWAIAEDLQRHGLATNDKAQGLPGLVSVAALTSCSWCAFLGQ
jgi:hypothetical protein